MTGESTGRSLANWRILAALLLLSVFAFYVATIREGHAWDDDAAMYIMHARNIVEGRPYADTGYIFNPEYPNLGPPSYPPGFPLLLAPVWAVSGLNLYPMKLLEVAFFVTGLGLLGAYFRRYLGESGSLALMGIVGFCPLLWSFKDMVSSDFAFLPFAYLALLLIDRAYPSTRPSSLREALPIALLIVAACSIRSIGGVLLPVLIAYDVLCRRRVGLGTLLITAIVLFLCAAEFWWLHSLGGTLSLFRLDLQTASHNVATYATSLREFWDAGRFAWLSWFLYGAAAGLAAWEVVARWRSRSEVHVAELFALAYLAVLLFYQPVETRFLFPVFPIYVALAVAGGRRLLRQLPPRASAIGATLALTVVALAYTAQYRDVNWGPIRESVMNDDFMRVTDFARTETNGSDIFLFRKPRMFALLTGRRALTYARVPGLGAFVSNAHVDYVIAAKSPHGALLSDQYFLWPFIHDHAGTLRLVYQNDGYCVYRNPK